MSKILNSNTACLKYRNNSGCMMAGHGRAFILRLSLKLQTVKVTYKCIPNPHHTLRPEIQFVGHL